MKNKLLLGLTAVACVGTAITVAAGVSNKIVKAANTEIRTIRFDTFSEQHSSEGAPFGLKVYNCFGFKEFFLENSKTSDKIGIAKNVGTIFELVKGMDSSESVCFSQIVSVSVNYSSTESTDYVALTIYNLPTSTYDENVTTVLGGTGTSDGHGGATRDTVTMPVDQITIDPVTGKAFCTDRYIDIVIGTPEEVTIYWIEYKYKCAA